MAIKRAPRPESNFYLLNKNISEDGSLSWGARGLLVYLLGKPDHWEVSVTDLIRQTKGTARPTGRDGVYGLLKELVEAGYVHREQPRGDSGKVAKVDYTVSEKPSNSEPLTAQPDTAQPHTAEPTQVSIEETARTDPKQTTASGIDFSDWPSVPSKQVLADWKKTRKAPLTQTAVERMATQMHKAAAMGYTVDECLAEACERGWRGFKAHWLESDRSQRKVRHHGISQNIGEGFKQNGDGTFKL